MKTLKISLLSVFAAGFLSYFYFLDPHKETGHFLACPFRMLTGWDCPGCGSQRLIHDLLHLNFAEAFHDNALLFISLPFVMYILGIFIANHVFGSHYRVKIFYKNGFVLGVFLLLVGFGIARNLPFTPFSYLLSPR